MSGSEAKTFYLGPYESAASRERYDRLIGEWLASGRGPAEQGADASCTVTELIAAYWGHVQSYYCDSKGRPTSEVDTIRQALRPVQKLYGSSPAVQFGPRCLETVRAIVIQKGWCRTHINRQVHRIRGMFRWATSKELIPSHVLEALRSVDALKKGRCAARESDPVKPVAATDIDAIELHVSIEVWTLVQLMLLTGARAGELVRLRPTDLDRSTGIWRARLDDHKAAHHGKDRMLYFGPRAQQLLRGFLSGRSLDEYLFSPKQAETERHARASMHRRPDQTPNLPRTDRVVGECYSVASFRRAIHRACDKAGIPRWSPHRLRHTAATSIRAKYGIEQARVILGHSSVVTTAIYAELDQQKAEGVIAAIGY